MERRGGGPGNGPEQQKKTKIYTVGRGSQPFTGPFGRPESRAAGPRLEEPVRIRVISRQGRSVWGEIINPDETSGPRLWFAFKPGKERGFI